MTTPASAAAANPGAGLFRAFICLAAFAVTFGIVCWTIRKALPFPDMPIVTPKVEHLATHGDRYDTLFIGSSRLYYQVIPSIFDEVTVQSGMPTKSFNAAVAGMGPPEDSYVLDYILRRPPKQLRWVFIELAALRLKIPDDRIGTARLVYWHDWPRLSILFRRALVVREGRAFHQVIRDLRPTVGQFIDHLWLFAENKINLGRASIFSERLLAPDRQRSVDKLALGPDGDGWMRTGRTERLANDDLADYVRQLEARLKVPVIQDLSDPVSQAALDLMLRKIEELGAKPVLIVPPTTSKRIFYPQPERARSTIVLDFSDIRRFPDLYKNENRLDTEHVNTAGSEVFTRLIAQEFIAAIGAGK